VNFRIGIGVDAHRCVKGRPLILGGVKIPAEFGLEAHSDGDVVAHALLDALFGAAALGDKGSHFPPSDPQYKDIRSLLLLVRCANLLAQAGWSIVNVDVSVVCEEPKLRPFLAAMRQEISAALGIKAEQISVKGTTSEGLGFTGRKEGIAAMAVALINRTTDNA
jgi:2-C-methyl-D-erythritol 2,4-cyclodiphosphate synthase